MSNWAANHTYLATAVVTPTTFVGYTWYTTAGGTSAGVEPVWPAAGSGVNTIVDGTVTWNRGTGARQSFMDGIVNIVQTFSTANPTIVASVLGVKPGSFAADATLPCFFVGDLTETVDTSQGVRTRTFSGFSCFLVDEIGTRYDSADRMDLAADTLADLFTLNFHAASGFSMLKHVGTVDYEETADGTRYVGLEFLFAESKIQEGRQ